MSAVEGVQATFIRTFSFNNPDEKASCRNTFIDPPATDVLASLVDLRGFLHHHSAKRKDNWDPDGHDAYRVPAIFSQRTAFAICWNAVNEDLFGRRSDERLEKVTDCIKGGG